MKIFMSWSGDLSKDVAEAVRVWLPSVLQSVKPYYTPNDVEKGARWSSDIAQELEESKVGLFFLTKENIENPWLNFEAGAISKTVSRSLVCSILFGIDKSDLSGPLSQFQATSFNNVDFFKLIKSINQALGDSSLPDEVVKSVFDMWWPQLNEKISEIMKNHTENGPTKMRSDRDIIDEIAGLVRMMAKDRSENKPFLINTIPDTSNSDFRTFLIEKAISDVKNQSVNQDWVKFFNSTKNKINKDEDESNS